jgi:N-carbamoyl-L-amino-acid hydrolase
MLRINAGRLHRRLDDLAQIGALEDGGVRRLAFSDADRAGRDFVEEWMRDLGLTIHVDALGNIAGVRDGAEDGPAVWIGSHTDSVGRAGRFDGTLGVLAALEAVQTLDDEGVTTRRPVGVVSFVNEEGNRYAPGMMGSTYVADMISLEDARAATGTDGSTLGDELDRTGMAGSDNLRALPVHAFVELHIEQGPVLEGEGTTIGVVESVQGITWHQFTLAGESNHAGVTPMDTRRDAGYVAVAIATHVRQLGQTIERQRATVGALSVEPGFTNIIPDEALLRVDLRNPDADRLNEARERLIEFAEMAASGEHVGLTHEQLSWIDPVQFNAEVVGAVESAADALGYSHRRMVSGAGHDAQQMAAVAPSAMIFVPSVGGISHNPDEFTRPEDVEAGANVLLHAMLQLAEKA